ncbi:MAG TPA: glycogen debranching protein GlgX [Bryobacteraceae bacterium]|nr:glycogen debranching protein GlgX [Bryobacteraceae bacterium]
MPGSLQFPFAVESGSPHPLGAVPSAEGVNFSLFSANATGVELLLFPVHDAREPSQVVRLDPYSNKTFHFWHVFVRGLPPGASYAYRVDGPFQPESGHRFNRNKVLIDPYSRGNNNRLWDRQAACRPDDNLPASMRSVVIDISGYDWQGDRPPRHPMEDTIIYEMHVRGFTRSPSSGARQPGTFAGLIEKIPYLKDLGVTAVELLPIFDFDEKAVQRTVDGHPLTNYWGYSTAGFFAPQSSYCVSPETGGHLREFRDLVRALHQAGIEVILDVVFNHTDEGNQLGPVFCFKGIDNRTYYFLKPEDLQTYLDFSGTGNTFNCNHPIAQKLIIECLRYWVREAHVDGFRFDEGSILTRGEDGQPVVHPPVVWGIELDDELSDVKVIAEAWDAAGLYQIGHFPGDRWAEWNGRFRDDLRRFVRGDAGMIGAVAARLAGSSDLYQARGQSPINSINFITCHDGFTLNDLVSYNEKHNEDNGEDNRDGNDNNLSWNCGVEGDSNDPAIEKLRLRQIRNFTVLLFLARGVPMFTAGDEVRRTQRGNNNPYCQDNEVSWLDWRLVEANRDLLRFWKLMIAFRKQHPALRLSRFYTGEPNQRGLADVSWHGTRLNSPGWDDPQARSLAMTIAGENQDPDLHVIMNMQDDRLTFELPGVAGRRWFKAVDTFQPPPADISDPGKEPPVDGNTCDVEGRSIVVLVNRAGA